MSRVFFFITLKYRAPILVLELRLIMNLYGSWFKYPNHHQMLEV